MGWRVKCQNDLSSPCVWCGYAQHMLRPERGQCCRQLQMSTMREWFRQSSDLVRPLDAAVPERLPHAVQHLGERSCVSMEPMSGSPQHMSSWDVHFTFNRTCMTRLRALTLIVWVDLRPDDLQVAEAA